MRRKLNYDEIFSQRPAEEDLKKLKRTPVCAVIENIRSMHNVGSIFRTSDGVRLQELVLCGFTARPPRPEINKTALGATETVPWSYAKSAIDAIKEFRQKGYQIVTVEHTTDSVPYYRAKYDFPVCLVFGNEVEGVSAEIVSMADMAVEIPMLGVKHSLNVSVAYAVIVYDLLAKYL